MLLGSSGEKAKSVKAIWVFWNSLLIYLIIWRKKTMYTTVHMTYCSIRISWGKATQINQSPPSLPFKCISFRKVTSSWLLAAAASVRVSQLICQSCKDEAHSVLETYLHKQSEQVLVEIPSLWGLSFGFSICSTTTKESWQFQVPT